MPSLDNRLILAAVVDRIIYGQPETFRREDALELLRQLPAPRPISLIRLPVALKVSGSMPGSRMSGSAAGHGDVSVEGDRRSFSYDSQAGRTIRIGQWKLRHVARFFPALRGQAVIEIVQAMGDTGDEGRAAVLVYERGEPVKLLGYREHETFLGRYEIIVSKPAPWKTPVHGQEIEAAYELDASRGKDGTLPWSIV